MSSLKKLDISYLAIVTAILLSGLTDMLRRFSLGIISLQGGLTILAAVASFSLILLNRKISKSLSTIPLLLLFILLGSVNLLIHASTLSSFIFGLQNLSVFMSFVGFTILGLIQSYKYPDMYLKIQVFFTKSFQISTFIYCFSLLIGGFGTSAIMGARSFGLFIMLGVAWFLALWRYQSPKYFAWTLFILVVLALSYSRTSLAVSLLLFPISQISFDSPKSLFRGILILISILTVSVTSFLYVPAIRDRFVNQGDNAQIAGIQINTSGRAEFWPAVFESALESPILGKGPGSVSEAVLSVNNTTGGHPHNDYLRIFHDYGILGFVLWLIGYFGILVKTLRNWISSHKHHRVEAHLHLSAFLSLLAIAIAMITDNVVVYVFSMTPLGILVGLSLGTYQSIRNKRKQSNLKIASSYRFGA
jgi:O-antigen ligase